MMKKAVRVLINIPWDYHYGRQVQHGICRYAQSHCLWAITRVWPSYGEKKWLRDADMVGMISMRRPREYMAIARRYGLAVVGVGTWAPGREFSGLPYADVDPRAIGEMAVEYFVDRGFRNFGMMILDEPVHSLYRIEAFVAALRRRGLDCDVFDFKGRYPPCGEPLPAVSGGAERIRRWLSGLLKPLAVFCIDDDAGSWVCAVCQRTGVHVPEEVAVLGADDDKLVCSTASPYLSSIALPAEQVGYEAAKILDAILCRRKVPKRPILLLPIGIETRQSTDVLAIEDSYVVRAIQYIREHAHEGIFAKNIMSEVRLSRRPLERRFKKALGRSPFAEIRRVQIEKVKTLLAQTDKTLETMAPECGFKTVTRMNVAFKKATGMSPGAYRKQFRVR